MREFQFLGRNSGRSDLRFRRGVRQDAAGFNSSVGILVVRTQSYITQTQEVNMFQFLGRNSGRSDAVRVVRPTALDWSFNSSVGILVVRTLRGLLGGLVTASVFQFLGRNSGRSDVGRGE